MTSHEGQPPGEGSTETERALRMPFVEKLEARQRSVNSLLCVGLDPVIGSIPTSLRLEVENLPALGYSEAETVADFYRKLYSHNPSDASRYLLSRIIEE